MALEHALSELSKLVCEKQGHAVRLDRGLSDHEIDRLLAPIELELPEEGRTLWRWRSGLRPGDSNEGGLLGPLSLLSLPLAISRRATERSEGSRLLNDDPDFDLERDFFPAAFIPFEGWEDLVCLDCSSPSRAIAPVHILHHADSRTISIAEPAFPSLESWALECATALQDGRWTYDRSSGHWVDMT